MGFIYTDTFTPEMRRAAFLADIAGTTDKHSVEYSKARLACGNFTPDEIDKAWRVWYDVTGSWDIISSSRRMIAFRSMARSIAAANEAGR